VVKNALKFNCGFKFEANTPYFIVLLNKSVDLVWIFKDQNWAFCGTISPKFHHEKIVVLYTRII
jgi:hypothetical protein